MSERQVTPLHAMKDKATTLCGLTVSHAEEGVMHEGTPVLIAPNKAAATCPECQMAQQPAVVNRSQRAVTERLKQEQERFDARRGAPPPEPPEGIDPIEVAQTVKDKQRPKGAT